MSLLAPPIKFSFPAPTFMRSIHFADFYLVYVFQRVSTGFVVQLITVCPLSSYLANQLANAIQKLGTSSTIVPKWQATHWRYSALPSSCGGFGCLLFSRCVYAIFRGRRNLITGPQRRSISKTDCSTIFTLSKSTWNPYAGSAFSAHTTAGIFDFPYFYYRGPSGLPFRRYLFDNTWRQFIHQTPPSYPDRWTPPLMPISGK